MASARLLDELFDSQPHPLAAGLDAWLASRRFAAFVNGHLPKIRKKLRGAQDPDSARDLLLELDTAYRLAQDKRLSLTYEPTPAGESRGPDFSVRFTTRLEFMVEVTRLKGSSADASATAGHGVDARRLAAVLALKLGQTVTDHANLLVVGIDDTPPTSEEIDSYMKEVRHETETTDPEVLLRKGFKHRGEYLRRLERLSAVLVKRAPTVNGGEPQPGAALWLNPRARKPLANEVRAVLVSAFEADG